MECIVLSKSLLSILRRFIERVSMEHDWACKVPIATWSFCLWYDVHASLSLLTISSHKDRYGSESMEFLALFLSRMAAFCDYSFRNEISSWYRVDVSEYISQDRTSISQGNYPTICRRIPFVKCASRDRSDSDWVVTNSLLLKSKLHIVLFFKRHC